MKVCAHKGIIFLVSAVVAALLVGCGDGSSTAVPPGAPSTATTAIGGSMGAPVQSTAQSTSQFVARADATCRRINAEISSIKANSASLAEIKRIVPRTVPLERRGVAALEKLAPPSSLANDWRRMLGYRRTLAGELAGLLKGAESKDAAALKALAASKKRTHASLTSAAKANGFKACAKVGTVG